MKIEIIKEVRIFNMLLWSTRTYFEVVGDVQTTEELLDQTTLFEYLRKIERELTRICSRIK